MAQFWNDKLRVAEETIIRDLEGREIEVYELTDSMFDDYLVKGLIYSETEYSKAILKILYPQETFNKLSDLFERQRVDNTERFVKQMLRLGKPYQEDPGNHYKITAFDNIDISHITRTYYIKYIGVITELEAYGNKQRQLS